MKTLTDIWESLAKPKYPTLNEHQLAELKIEAVTQWAFNEDTELCKIYDQYVMMKNLLGAKSEA